MIASSGASRLELLQPARLEDRRDAERLHARAQVHEVIGVAEGPDHAPGDVDLDDVAAVDALLDPVAQLPDEHRRRRFGAAWARLPRPAPGRDGGGLGGHGVRVLRPMLRCRSMPTPSMPATLHVSNHPAVLHKLAILRDEKTEPKKFREVVRELSWLLGYEALADARVRPRKVTDADRDHGRPRARRAHRPGPDPAGRPRAWSTRCSS